MSEANDSDLLAFKTPQEVMVSGPRPLDSKVLAQAAEILEDVRARGETAVRAHGERLGDLKSGAALLRSPAQLKESLEGLEASKRGVLERAAEGIRRFAEAQRACLSPLETEVEGGVIGHDVSPVQRAGCYAPGGRFPLPSTVLMTAVTARAAGVPEVWLASPKTSLETEAAASIAGVDGLLCVGGAQAIAAMAVGAGVPRCDVIAGPGNAWVTAAKKLVAGEVAIDMLAGPSEVLVIADGSADPATIAADLLAQCEHDVQARGILVTPSRALAEEVRKAALEQLESLPTRSTAEPALRNSAAVVTADLAEACQVSNAVAPEHLELMVQEPDAVLPKLLHFGGLFIGQGAAEVLGDYGLGPNHTLPTEGTARSTGGLSVFTFLRTRTFMRFGQSGPQSLYEDAAEFARMEGLEAHARSAEHRLKGRP